MYVFVPTVISHPPLPSHDPVLLNRLRKHVECLATAIGPRNVVHYEALQAAADYIASFWAHKGLHVTRHEYRLRDELLVANLEVELRGTIAEEEIILLGAHYDSLAPDCPGANDNATGVAAILELAPAVAAFEHFRTIRCVAFVNEEPPYFLTDEMGSARYAEVAKARKEKIVAMINLETIGYFSDEPDSQSYPPPLSLFYPNTGNFIAIVGNLRSRSLVERFVTLFRKHSTLPAQSATLPAFFPWVGASDHQSFWKHGYPALMVTDTAPFRYPHYHLPSDTPDKIDYKRFAQVVSGVEAVIRAFASRRENQNF